MLSNSNLNLTPYYDDFDQTKNFHRILFRPGYAVQARELTQLQTQLQNQIANFGDHIFKDGSLVLGGNSFSDSIYYVKVVSNDVSGFVGRNFVGQTSGALCKVIKTAKIDNTTSKIYFSYINGNRIQTSETITTTTEVVSSIFSVSVITATTGVDFQGIATTYSIEESVYYVKGNFVYCEPQTIIISEDTSATCRIGLLAAESIVTSSQDTSLLDPALGSYNYSAPGADRFCITLTLTSYTYDPSIDSVSENASSDFIELSRYVDGLQVTVNRLPIYSEIENTFARRTYDESGDYTVRAFGLKVKEHVYANTELLSLQVEPGKAYIKGYEFETISPTYINLPKSRDTSNVSSYPIYSNYGKYLLVEDLAGDLDYTANKVLNIYNDKTIQTANTLIGNCRVKTVDYDGYTNGKNVYKLYIDSVYISNTANAISSSLSFANTTLAFTANISTNSYTTGVVLQGNDVSSYIINTSQEYTKTLLDGAISNVEYETIKRFASVGFAANNATLTNPVSSGQTFIGSGTLSQSEVRENYIVTVTSSGSSGIPVGTQLTYEGGLRISVTSAVEIALQYVGAIDAYVSVVAKIAVTSASYKTKTSNTTGSLTVLKAEVADTMSLQKADCYKLVSVTAVSNTSNTYDYTSSYELFTGQTDTMYDHGYIKLKTGYINPIVDSTANIQSLVVNFEYFNHSSDSGFFSVDSYTDVNYEDIPEFTSSTGTVYKLRNCLDFRPRRQDGSSLVNGILFLTPSTLLYTDYKYYLGRIDRLVLTKERKFSLIKGIPSVNPSVPTDIPDSMSLYIITVPPYTINSNEVSYSFVENKRYTMRDIGRIEKRVERLEYYTSLSLLEKQANDESIPSVIPTVDRFKNGILVDSFAGHSVGDISNSDYRCSIDYKNKILRPPFSAQSYTFKYNSGTNVTKCGDLVVLSYTTETLLNQPLASAWVNLNPYSVFAWNGTVDLVPPSDNWVDTTIKPDLIVNLNGENDVYTVLANNVSNPASVGVRWSDWQTIINGVPQVTDSLSSSTTVATSTVGDKTYQTTSKTSIDNQKTTISDTLARTGLEISTGAVQTITRDLGSKIVDTSIVPYIRSRVVDFYAKSLKPSCNLFATFDGVDVSSYCVPATEIVVNGTVETTADSISLVSDSTVTGKIIFKRNNRIFIKADSTSSNSSLTFEANNSINWLNGGSFVSTGTILSVTPNSPTLATNSYGDVAGSFLIPNNDSLRFRVGEKLFRLADAVGDSATTAAASKYVAQGLSQSTERTVVATRIATASINPVFDVDVVTDSSTKTITTTTNTVVDVTPPPSPPQMVVCAQNIPESGRRGTHTFTINLGEEIGLCGIDHNTHHIPDRYTVIWNGNVYTTGFVGSHEYNRHLNSFGHPNVTGVGSGHLRFNKTSKFPSTATLIIDAPLHGTGWNYTVLCPTVTPTITTATLSVHVSGTKTYEFNVPFELTGTAEIPLTVKVEKTDGTKNKWNKVAFSAVEIATTDHHIHPMGTYVASHTTFTPSPITGLKTGNYGSCTMKVPHVPVAHEYVIRVTATSTEYSDAACTVATGSTATAVTDIRVFSDFGENREHVDPVAQTFFVDSQSHPDGIFVDSLDLYFRSKSATLPVTVQLRPTVNGYPSSRDILPFSIVTKLAEDITVSVDSSVATNFKFESPIYLAPGEYSFVALCNTDEYEIYTAKIGDFLLTDSNVRITSQPAIGSMFKSQNSSTWTPTQEEDIMFKLNRCVFDTTVTGQLNLYTDFQNYGDVEYDTFFADGEVLDFAKTNIDYSYLTSSIDNVVDSVATQYQLGTNAPMVSRRMIRAGYNSDLQFDMSLTTENSDISPVVDLTRMSTVLVKNIINNAELNATNFIITDYGTGYANDSTVVVSSTTTPSVPVAVYGQYDANTGRIGITVTDAGSGYTGNVTAVMSGGGASANATVIVENEIRPQGGNALAKYITRKVNLASGFESVDLKAYILANIPSSTSIKVYYKVIAALSVSEFDSQEWNEMTIESSGVPSESGFVEYKYKTTNNVALLSGERFKTFAVKIVMLSSQPTKVPQIKDLRVIALDD